MNNSELKTYRLIIKGKVQNVGFRHWFSDLAISLGLNGYVQNKESKDEVEAIIQGNMQSILSITEKSKTGPELALVEGVIPNNIDDATERFKFGIRDTGKKIAGDFDSASHQIRQQKRDDIRAQGQQQKIGRQKGGRGKKKKNKYVFRTRKKCPNVHKVNKHNSSRKRKCK